MSSGCLFAPFEQIDRQFVKTSAFAQAETAFPVFSYGLETLTPTSIRARVRSGRANRLEFADGTAKSA